MPAFWYVNKKKYWKHDLNYLTFQISYYYDFYNALHITEPGKFSFESAECNMKSSKSKRINTHATLSSGIRSLS